MTNACPPPLLPSPYQSLSLHLKQLQRSQLLTHWEALEHQAMQERWASAPFLLALCAWEARRRWSVRLQRALSEAQRPNAKTLANFDWSHVDRFDWLILDDLGDVKKSEAETAVLFELYALGGAKLYAHRYDPKRVLITAHQPFSQWDSLFTDSMMTVAAVDRLVHHVLMVEIQTDSYRKQAAVAKSASTSLPQAQVQ